MPAPRCAGAALPREAAVSGSATTVGAQPKPATHVMGEALPRAGRAVRVWGQPDTRRCVHRTCGCSWEAAPGGDAAPVAF